MVPCHALDPRAEQLAAAAAALSPAAAAALAAAPLEPLYLAAPFITRSKRPVFA